MGTQISFEVLNVSRVERVDEIARIILRRLECLSHGDRIIVGAPSMLGTWEAGHVHVGEAGGPGVNACLRWLGSIGRQIFGSDQFPPDHPVTISLIDIPADVDLNNIDYAKVPVDQIDCLKIAISQLAKVDVS